MGRWTQYDDDSYRLPEGMKRVGYDADTQRYTFKDTDGSLWMGPEGSEFGDLTKVGTASHQPKLSRHSSESESDEDVVGDLEASTPRRGDGDQYLLASDSETALGCNRGPYRTLLPFLLMILVTLLLVVRLVSPLSLGRSLEVLCPEESRSYGVKSGDSCWAISQEFGTSVEKLQRINDDVDCGKLIPGQQLCIPLGG